MKPTPYFPSEAIPDYQEIGTALDSDSSLEQAADVEIDDGYADSGEIEISASGVPFALWPEFGYVENQRTLEMMFYWSKTDDTLYIRSSGRALNGTTAQAGLATDNVRFIEARVLGKHINQLFAEVKEIEEFLMAGVGLTSDDLGDVAFKNVGTSDGDIPQVNEPIILSDSAHISIDARLAGPFRVTLGGNRILDLPPDGVDGQSILLEIIQDGVGNRTLDLSAFELPVDADGTEWDVPVQPTWAESYSFLLLKYVRGYWHIQNYVMYKKPT
jgi:hypothetical protein